jgi:signal transduction histidine kinase
MRRPWLTWLFVGTLFALCAVLGALQYQWIGEVSEALRGRLRTTLQVNLGRLAQDFNNEIASAYRGIAPIGAANLEEAEQQVENRFEQAKRANPGVRVFRRLGLAIPRSGQAELEMLDFADGRLKPAEWPDEWSGPRSWIEARLQSLPREGGGPGMGLPFREAEGLIFEAPIFAPGGPGRGGGRGPGRGFGRTELAWAVVELNGEYVRDTVLPETVQRHLDPNEYEVEVLTRGRASVVWDSDPKARRISDRPDGSIGLLDLRLGGFGDGGRGRGGRGGPGMGPDSGRWVLYARHRAGSLDAVVEETRRRNLGVTGGVLLLLMVTLGALMRFTRNAQRLAHMQMDFVAGVSHELRTPLTAIYTAGHNLRGRVAQNPSQVERYGEMIQQESGRLRDLVEQVLRFASADAGKVIQAPSPVSVESVIEQSVESSRPVIQAARCTVEKHIAEDLPEIVADPLALKHALQNLLTNAVKYAAPKDPWIGITAASSENGVVEIRVADRGPGIPEDEQSHIFDPFYRGRRALQDQIHGAGLGLNLVKKIIEAHGGTVRVKSAPDEGAEFIVRIPAALAGAAR